MAPRVAARPETDSRAPWWEGTLNALGHFFGRSFVKNVLLAVLVALLVLLVQGKIQFVNKWFHTTEVSEGVTVPVGGQVTLESLAAQLDTMSADLTESKITMMAVVDTLPAPQKERAKAQINSNMVILKMARADRRRQQR